jgi:hypothetical protein
MTNEELIKRLRDVQLNEVAEEAADRIEALVKEVDATHEEAMEWIAAWGHARKGHLEADVKLARAVEALREIYDDGIAIGRNPQWMMNVAGKVLAELEKTE